MKTPKIAPRILTTAIRCVPVAFMAAPSGVWATTYNVTTASQLTTAINSVNAGAGGDTIVLGGNITLGGVLPSLSKDVTIDGSNFSLSGANSYRILSVLGGQVTVQNISLINGKATGGRGGDGGASNGAYTTGGGGGGGAGFLNGVASNGGTGGSVTSNSWPAGGTAGTNGGAGGSNNSGGYATAFGTGGGGGAGGSGNSSYEWYNSGGYNSFGGGYGGSGGYGDYYKSDSDGGGGGGGGGSLGAGGAIYLAGGSISLTNVTLNNNNATGGAGGNGGNSVSSDGYGGDGGGGGSGYGGAILAYTGTTISITGGSFGSGNAAVAGAGGSGGTNTSYSSRNGYAGSAGSVAGQDLYLMGGTLNYAVASGSSSVRMAATYSNGIVNKTGAGTMVFSEANTNYFTLNVQEGTVANSVANAFGAIRANISSGATLALGASDSVYSLNGAGNVNLQGNTLIVQSAAGLAASNLSGQILGAGVLVIQNGRQVLSGVSVLPAAANLRLDGSGILGLGSGNLTANLGTGAGQVEWRGGGFAAYGADRQITFNGGATLAWGVDFATSTSYLYFGGNDSAYSTTLTNSINLGSNQTILYVQRGTGSLDAVFSGNISGAGGGLAIDGGGVVKLTGTNTYTGPTTVYTGTLQVASGSLSPSSNLTLFGGTLGLSGNYNAQTGSGAGQLAWQGGGFAAYGADRSVTLNGGAALTIGTDIGLNSYSSYYALRLGSATSTHTATLTNNLANTGTIYWTVDNGAASVDGVLSGVISGTGTFYKSGGGTLALSGTNADSISWMITDGTLQVGISGLGQTGTGSMTIRGINSRLAGSGSVRGATTIGSAAENGVIEPGDSSGSDIGRLTFADTSTNSLTLAGGNRVRVRLTIRGATGNATGLGDSYTDGIQTASLRTGAPAAGTHDSIDVKGTLNLTSGARFQFTLDGYAPAEGDVFNVLDWGGINASTFSLASDLDLSAAQLNAGLVWNTSQFLTDGILYVTPEPSVALAIMIGALPLLLGRRRQARRIC